MIEEILTWPLELKVIIGSGLIMMLYEYGRENGLWGKQKNKDQQSKKY